MGGGEEDRCVGDEAVERDGLGEEDAGGAECAARARDARELGVVAGFAGETGEVHGEEDGVGSDEGEPEVEVAEGFGEEASGVFAGGGEEREPIVGCGVEGEDSGHGHDEVEVGDDEGRVVEVLVEYGLGEDGAGEASCDEEADEAEAEEHCGGVTRLGAPDGG